MNNILNKTEVTTKPVIITDDKVVEHLKPIRIEKMYIIGIKC